MERESARGSGARRVENGIGPAGWRFIIFDQRSGRTSSHRGRLSVLRCGAFQLGRTVHRETDGRDGQIRIRGALRPVTGCMGKTVATIAWLSCVPNGEWVAVNDLDVIPASGGSDLRRECNTDDDRQSDAEGASEIGPGCHKRHAIEDEKIVSCSEHASNDDPYSSAMLRTVLSLLDTLQRLLYVR